MSDRAASAAAPRRCGRGRWLTSRTIALAGVVSLLMCSLAAAQSSPILACVPVVPAESVEFPVVQFERETFPPFTETGVYETRHAQILYVEQGQVTVFSDTSGTAIVEAGKAFLAEPSAGFAVVNEDAVQDATVLWVRLAEAPDIEQGLGFLAPAALPAFSPAAHRAQAPLFIEFDVPSIEPSETRFLFIGILELPPDLDPIVSTADQPLTTTGRIAVVVESGNVDVRSSEQFSVFSGEWAPIEGGQPYQISGPPGEWASGFLVGLIEDEDSGYMATLVADTRSALNCPP